MKRFNLLVYVYRGINTLEEKFTRKNHPDYTSDLSKHILIVTGVFIGATLITSLLGGVVMSMQHGNFSPNLSVGMGIGLFFLSTTPFLCCVAYWIYYLKRHLYLFSTTGQKNRIWTVHLCDACYSGTVYFPAAYSSCFAVYCHFDRFVPVECRDDDHCLV